MSKFNASGYEFLQQVDELTDILENKFTGSLIMVHYPELTCKMISGTSIIHNFA